MATRIFWRQTKRGVRLCVRDRLFETAIASVETGFGFDFESGTRGFEVSASPSGFSHGHESWTRLGTVAERGSPAASAHYDSSTPRPYSDLPPTAGHRRIPVWVVPDYPTSTTTSAIGPNHSAS